jgi:signal transduction histidine kinase
MCGAPGRIRLHLVWSSIPRPPRFDIVLVAVLVGVAITETLTSSELEVDVRTVAGAVLTPLPLLWRRTAPLGAMVAVFVLWPASGASDSLYTFVCGLVAAYSCGGHPDARRAYAGAAVIGVFIAAALAFSDRGGAADFLFITILFGGGWALGRVVHERTLRGAAAERRAERAELDREAAIADERRRIARELHDVVAHTVSLMIVQTGVVRRRLRHDRPEEGELLAEVEETGREAIAELRRLLGILRTDDDGPALAPQPGIAQLEPLLAQVRAAGLPVEVRVEGDPVALAPGVDLAAYRIVQESLTNSLKHAKAGRAHVVLRYGDAELGIEVTDDGLGESGHAANGTGHGLIGMRERVALYGGDLAAGPNADRGYAVHARLPFREARS